MLYLALGSRPDISFAVSTLSRHCAKPLESHFTAVRYLLKYVKSTTKIGLIYPGQTQHNKANVDFIPKVRGYTYSDWASNQVDRRSIGGYAFFLESSLISWKAKRQTIVALSTVEAELMAASEGAREAVWLGNILEELQPNPEKKPAVQIACDNQGTLSMITRGTLNTSGRSKHIDIRQHHARDLQIDKIVDFHYVNTVENVADALTKPLPLSRHSELMDRMNLGGDCNLEAQVFLAWISITDDIKMFAKRRTKQLNRKPMPADKR